MYALPRAIPDLKVLLAPPKLSAADIPNAFVEREGVCVRRRGSH
jgi:hypothetical protein